MQYFEKTSKMIALQDKLIHAVIKGEIETVRELLEPENKTEDTLIPDVNGDVQDVPLILFAATRGDWKMVSEFYFYGANIDVCSVSRGWHLVNEVTVNASDKTFEALVPEFDMDVVTRDGNSPLMVALMKEKYDRARYLLENSVIQVSVVNLNKENAGHLAIKKGQNDLFLKLVEHGMPYDVKNKEGKTALDLIEDPLVKEDLKIATKKLEEKGKVRYSAGSESVYVPEEQKEEVKEVKEVKKLGGLSSIKRA